MEKHAYLIIAHKFDDTFKTLLKMIDYEYNDIFIHFDVKNKDYDIHSAESIVKKSKVYHTKRTSVVWGKNTQILAELILLKMATKVGKYQYYHLLSGQDLPIKTQEYIHKFLKNKDREYVEIDEDKEVDAYRIRYFHIISEKLSVRDNILRDKKLQEWQEKVGIKRNTDLVIRKGSNWFSITDECARYIVKKELWIRWHFSFSICADELFLQTLLYNSKFKEKFNHDDAGNKYSYNYREIDWVRCNGMNPHIYTKEDIDILNSSKALFARKFDCTVDNEIIETIYKRYSI